MAQYIAIIEKDFSVINDISRLVNLLSYRTIVLYTWEPSALEFPHDKIAAAFMNIELPALKTDEIITYFNKDQVPVFYLYKNPKFESYKKVKALPHYGELKKPFRLEEAYLLLERFLTFDNPQREEIIVHEKLDSYRRFFTETSQWLDQFQTLLK